MGKIILGLIVFLLISIVILLKFIIGLETLLSIKVIVVGFGIFELLMVIVMSWRYFC